MILIFDLKLFEYNMFVWVCCYTKLKQNTFEMLPSFRKILCGKTSSCGPILSMVFEITGWLQEIEVLKKVSLGVWEKKLLWLNFYHKCFWDETQFCKGGEGPCSLIVQAFWQGQITPVKESLFICFLLYEFAIVFESFILYPNSGQSVWWENFAVNMVF